MISPDQLKYFIEVAQVGHLTRAAERLGISQPTLSHAIQKMEAALKSKLLLRSKKGVQLTQSGEILYKSAQTLVENWKRVQESISLNQDKPQGLIRLGCHAAVGKYALPPFFPELLGKYPELNFQLTHGLSRQITDLVISGSIDIGIVVNPVHHPDLIIMPLYEDKVCLWKSRLCKNHDVLLFEPSLLQSLDILNQLKKKRVQYHRMVESSSLEVIAELVASGAGTGILPQRIIKTIRKHQCHVVSDSPIFIDKICLVYKKEFRKTERGKVFIETVKTL